MYFFRKALFLSAIIGFFVSQVHLPLYAQKTTKTQSKNLTRQPSAKALPFLKQGQEQEQKNDIQGALRSYTQAINANPQDPFGYAYRGQLYYTRFSNWEKAKDDLNKSLQLWDAFAAGYFLRGLCKMNTQNLQGALIDFHTSIALDSTNVMALFNLGTVFGLLEQFGDAEHIMSLAIQRNSTTSLFYKQRGDFRYYLRKYDSSLADYNKYLFLNKDDSTVYSKRAKLKSEMGNRQEAIDDYSYLIKTRGYYFNNYFNRASIYNQLNQLAAANDDLETILRHDPNEHRARISLANNFFTLGQPQKTIEECTYILRHNPQDVRAFGNVLGAINALDMSWKFVNEFAYYARGIARFEVKDTIGACADWTKAEALGSTSATIYLRVFCHATKNAFTPSPGFPAHYQFFPRSPNNDAVLAVSGVVSRTGYDSAYCAVYKNDTMIQRLAAPLIYTESKASISFSPMIQATCSQYSLRVGIKSTGGQDTVICQRDSLVCGDVFFMSGQSNSVMGNLKSVPENSYIRTFCMGAKDSYWYQATGDETSEANIGAAALQTAAILVRRYQIPICIINGGIRGSIIEQHFRNDVNPSTPRSWYGRMLWRTQQGALAQAAKAMIWYQGESNEGDGYTAKFKTMYSAWKRDYTELKKFYVVQIRPSNCIVIPNQASLREQQRAFMKQFPDVETIASTGLPMHDGCHYSNEGYITLGNQLAALLSRDFYAATDTVGISSPNLVRASWTNTARSEMRLTFATNDSLVISQDTLLDGKLRTFLNEAFLLDGKPFTMIAVKRERNTLLLRLPAPNSAQTISYIPDKCYSGTSDGTCSLYEGPWLLTRRGVGALTFHNVPIEPTP